MILNTIIEKNLYQFVEQDVSSWEEAIRISCKQLEAAGIVDSSFAQILIDSVLEHGPYIVLLPNLAMPHTSTNAEGVNDTAIAFTRFKNPVSFDSEDGSKDAQVFFTLASTDEQQHLKNMASLFELLSEGNSLELVMDIRSFEDLEDVAGALGHLK